MSPIRRFTDRRPRMLAPSRILRPPPRQTGGGREREDLVDEAQRMIRKGSKSTPARMIAAYASAAAAAT